eukprot:scaffold18608_cov97-Isochrysis_galbana.AAC.2
MPAGAKNRKAAATNSTSGARGAAVNANTASRRPSRSPARACCSTAAASPVAGKGSEWRAGARAEPASPRAQRELTLAPCAAHRERYQRRRARCPQECYGLRRCGQLRSGGRSGRRRLGRQRPESARAGRRTLPSVVARSVGRAAARLRAQRGLALSVRQQRHTAHAAVVPRAAAAGGASGHRPARLATRKTRPTEAVTRPGATAGNPAVGGRPALPLGIVVSGCAVVRVVPPAARVGCRKPVVVGRVGVRVVAAAVKRLQGRRRWRRLGELFAQPGGPPAEGARRRRLGRLCLHGVGAQLRGRRTSHRPCRSTHGALQGV